MYDYCVPTTLSKNWKIVKLGYWAADKGLKEVDVKWTYSETNPKQASAVLEAAISATKTAISTIEVGLTKIGAAEKKAYNACFAKASNLERCKKPVSYLKTIGTCWNLEGKSGFDCTGKRRKCATGMCCGEAKDNSKPPKVVSTVCYDQKAAKYGVNTFTCLNATKLIGAFSTVLGASYMMA